MKEYITKRIRIFYFTLLLIALFLALCYKYFDFTIDDAFIAWRYSDNLVEHGALTWNPGQYPVEGFTSFLWVILNAGVISVGISPVVFSKSLSILSVLVIVVVLLRKGADQPWHLQLGLPAALALSPAVAVLTIQGLETMFAALLMLATSAISVRIMKAPSRNRFLLWYGCAFVAGLVRPDTLVFSAGIFVALVSIFHFYDQTDTKSFLKLSIPFFVLGVVYMSWRIWYFGYLFPNTFYIKGGFMLGGIGYVALFFLRVLFPYLIIGIFSAVLVSDDRITDIIPTLTGSLSFVAYFINIYPVQGFLWRFAIPVLPPLLYCILHLPWPVKLSQWKKWTLGVFLFLWPIQTYPTANREVMHRPVHDRIAVGKALQGLDGRMFTSESGALAYYSDWAVVDIPGLNSEKIAHGTPPQKVLRNFEPDVIGLLVPDKTIEPSNWRFKPTLPYIQNHGYVAVAATQKRPGAHHLFFVNPTSPLCKEVVSRLRTIDSVAYTPVDTLIPDSLDISTISNSKTTGVQEVCTDPSVTRETVP